MDFNELHSKLISINFDKFDLIVAIGNGGIVPGALIQNFLKIPMEILWINFRDENNNPIRKEPIVTKINTNLKKLEGKKILIVDDVTRTGATLKKAKDILKNNKLKTFVINGQADYCLTNQVECLKLPWNNNLVCKQ